jgi:hypothetical protein
VTKKPIKADRKSGDKRERSTLRIPMKSPGHSEMKSPGIPT